MPRAHAYHHGNLRRALCDAALALFSERGSLDFTMRELARRAGVTHNAPYRHFAGKEELRAALAAEGYALLREATLAAGRGVKDSRRRIRALGEAYVRFPLDHPHHFRLMVTTPLGEGADPELVKTATSSFEVLLDAIAAGRSSGAVRKDLGLSDLGLVAWALVHGLASLLLGGQIPADHASVKRYAALAEKTFFEGAGEPPRAKKRRRTS